MLIFGHLGYGAAIRRWVATPNIRHEYTRPFLFGTLLPDLVDKPLYAINQFGIRQEWWNEVFKISHLISGTRTFGHTLLFTLLIYLYSKFHKKISVTALSFGMLTHLMIDPVSDMFRYSPPVFGPPAWFFPLQGLRFQERMYDPSWTLWQQLAQPSLILMEISGALLIYFIILRKK